MVVNSFHFEIFDIKQQMTLTLKWILWLFDVVFEVLCALSQRHETSPHNVFLV